MSKYHKIGPHKYPNIFVCLKYIRIYKNCTTKYPNIFRVKELNKQIFKYILDVKEVNEQIPKYILSITFGKGY